MLISIISLSVTFAFSLISSAWYLRGKLADIAEKQARLEEHILNLKEIICKLPTDLSIKKQIEEHENKCLRITGSMF